MRFALPSIDGRAAVSAAVLLLLAPAPGTQEPRPKDHWAFVPPVREAVAVAGGWAKNPVDVFVARRLAEVDLEPSAEAEPHVLLRRLYLDLIGLPPAPEDAEAFVAAHARNADAAVADVVERLLASPRFGEKWARSWLDLARYADSNGFQADQLRPSWAYRDWVVRALNAGMPFDRFTVEQLAGDLLPDATLDQRVATGFHRSATCNVEAGVHPEENRVNQVFDRVDTTATVWLGLTMECAQCHDHKHDPFSSEEYYRLFAYFNNTPLEVELPSGVTDVSHDFVGPWLELPLPPEEQSLEATLAGRLAELEAARRAEVETRAPRWIEAARDSLDRVATWRVLEVADFASTGEEEVRPLDDGSVLLVGPVPDRATYTVDVRAELDRITLFKLEALTHAEIPGGGPGRGDPERTNFVLREIELTADGAPVALERARASFSQDGWNAAGAIDGDPESGWAIAPRFGSDHWITFQPDEPLHAAELEFRLRQDWGRGRVMGRVRISVSDGDPELLALPDEIVARLREPAAELDAADHAALEAQFASVDAVVADLDRHIAETREALARIEPDRTLVMVELDEPRATHVLERGDYLRPGERVAPGTPAALHAPAPDARRDRLGLARWIVDPRNPLTARVVVNRWWAELFGRGIVTTLEDFGTQAEPPTHPALLDWLAVELVESGWDMKRVLATIVTSATYRQDSRISAAALARDPANERYARGPRFRLSAETIRDQALAAAGLLSVEMFGPPVMPYQPPGVWRAVGRNAPQWETAADEGRYRRGLYVVWRRAAPYASFVNFDAPDRAACTVQRPRTNTPQQALTLLNDPVYLEAALALADRALGEDPADPVGRMVALILGRPATEPERAVLDDARDARRRQYARDPAKADEVTRAAAGAHRPRAEDAVELAACFHVAHILLNLDEAITKG